MSKVKNIQDYQDKDKFKIEGEAFERIKQAKEALDKDSDRIIALLREKEKEFRKAQELFWEVVYKEIGKKNSKKDLKFNKEYEELGFYIVEKHEPGGFEKFLESLKD